MIFWQFPLNGKYDIIHVQEYKNTRLQHYKNTRVQDYKITRTHECEGISNNLRHNSVLQSLICLISSAHLDGVVIDSLIRSLVVDPTSQGFVHSLQSLHSEYLHSEIHVSTF